MSDKKPAPRRRAAGELGRLPAQPSRPRLRLGPFLRTVKHPAHPARDWLSAVPSWPMFKNDVIGDCVLAASGHMIQAWTQYADGDDVVISDEQVVSAYSAITGYDPVTGANDNGTLMQDALGYWRKHGIGGHKIVAFASVALDDRAAVQAALDLFGGLYVGAWMPRSASAQFGAGKVWDVVPGDDGIPGSWGGHAIHVGRFDDPADTMGCTTWGQVQGLTEAWWDKYVDECWVVITHDWLNRNGNNPEGLDLHGLGEQFSWLTGEQNPFPASSSDPVVGADRVADRIFLAEARRWLRSPVTLPRHRRLRRAIREWIRQRQL